MSERPEPRRLYKSRANRMIDGVCGGVAEYLNVDPTIVRIAWIVSVFVGGAGIFLYIAGMILMPVNVDQLSAGSVERTDSRRIWGIGLIVVGALLLLGNIFHWEIWWNLISWKYLGPILLIAAGFALVLRNVRSRSSSSPDDSRDPSIRRDRKQFFRSHTEKKLFGVCGGIAEYFNVDPTLVRLMFVVLTLSSLGLGVILYVILALAMPERKFTSAST